MIYDKELVRFKHTKFDHPKGLQKFAATRLKKEHKFERMLQQSKFCGNSIHGVYYIWEKETRSSIRIFWGLIVIAAIISCIVMYQILSTRHNEQQIKTVVETSQMPIYTVNFPAVAVCPWNRVNWVRSKAAEERFLPQHSDNSIKQLFHDLLAALEDMSLTRLERLNVLSKYKTIPRVIDSINLFDLINFMAFRCDELFVSCKYDETSHDCCKIFVAEHTQQGVCMVFNSIVSEESKKKKLTDQYYPWNARKSGEGNGLVLTLSYNKTYQRPDSIVPFGVDLTDQFYPWNIRKAGEGSGLVFKMRYNKTYQRPESKIMFGINVMIKQADAWSEQLTHYMMPNTQNYVSLTPIITETSTNTRSMPPHKRRCLFPDEKHEKYERIDVLPFNKLNCYVQCQHKNVIKTCNCTLPWFLPKFDSADLGDCKVSDLQCIFNNSDVFGYIKSPIQDQFIKDTRRGLICDCVDSCFSMVHLININTNLVFQANASVPIIRADIFFGQSVITKYGARLDYTLLDLLANFGGILGLCLGASVLSLAEVLYATIKIIAVLIVTKRIKWRKIHPMYVVKFLKK